MNTSISGETTAVTDLRILEIFALPSDEHLTQVLRQVGEGHILLHRIDSGVYSQVFSIEGEPIVLKVLGDDPGVAKSLEISGQRYGDMSTWMRTDSVLLETLKTRKTDILYKLLQLVYQHEFHLKFLADHVIPKKFAILTMTAPLIGGEVTINHFTGEQESNKDSVTEDNPLISLPSGIEGKIVTVKLKDGEKKLFQQWEDNHPNGRMFSIILSPGEHIVEVQKRIQFENSGPLKVFRGGVVSYIESKPAIKVWTTQFVRELLNFLSKLIDMLVVGVSIDSSYWKNRDANFVVLVQNGEQKILLYDTNNWEVSDRYVKALEQLFLGQEVADPFPGVENSAVDHYLVEKLIIPILVQLFESRKLFKGLA